MTLETPREGQASHTHVHEIIAELRKLGWSVDLFAATRGGASTGAPWARRLRDYAGTGLSVARRLKAYDALFVRAHFMAAPVTLLAQRLGIPVVQEVNGRPDDLAVTYPKLRTALPALNALYRMQLRRADHLVAVTDGLAQWAASFGGHDRISTVPNGANVALFTPNGSVADPGYRYAVFVGGLVGWHGIGSMIAATKEQAWPEGVRLVVIGDGPERRLLESCDPAKIAWLGKRPYAEIPAHLRGALVALCLIESPRERSASGVAPLKLFEAMACGVPVIASDLPFQRDIVRDNGAGEVIPPADPRRLAAAVRAYAERHELRAAHGERAAAYVRACGSWAARARDIAAVLETAITRGRHGSASLSRA